MPYRPQGNLQDIAKPKLADVRLIVRYWNLGINRFDERLLEAVENKMAEACESRTHQSQRS